MSEESAKFYVSVGKTTHFDHEVGIKDTGIGHCEGNSHYETHLTTEV
jgi:hypothetical protein